MRHARRNLRGDIAGKVPGVEMDKAAFGLAKLWSPGQGDGATVLMTEADLVGDARPTEGEGELVQPGCSSGCGRPRPGRWFPAFPMCTPGQGSHPLKPRLPTCRGVLGMRKGMRV